MSNFDRYREKLDYYDKKISLGRNYVPTDSLQSWKHDSRVEPPSASVPHACKCRELTTTI